MKIKDLLERSGVQSLSGGCGEEEITALTYDSRKAQTGSLFFCLRGARSNGEDFAPAAYAQGCRCFVRARWKRAAISASKAAKERGRRLRLGSERAT